MNLPTKCCIAIFMAALLEKSLAMVNLGGKLYGEKCREFNNANTKCHCWTSWDSFGIDCFESRKIRFVLSFSVWGIHLKMYPAIYIICDNFNAEDYKLLSPLKIDSITEVEFLNCPLDENNSIAGIVDKLGMTQLKELWYEADNLSDFSDQDSKKVELPVTSFASLENLRVLDLSLTRPYLTTLPSTIRLTSLPPGIFRNQRNLLELKLWGNSLRNLSKDAFEGLSSLSHIDLGSNGIVALQPDIFEFLTNLSYISLNDNKLTQLPVGLLEHQYNLVKLDLSNNQLKSLPDDFFKNTNKLEKVNLAHNHPKEIFWSIFKNLDLLKGLHFNNTRIKNVVLSLLKTNHIRHIEIELGNFEFNWNLNALYY